MTEPASSRPPAIVPGSTDAINRAATFHRKLSNDERKRVSFVDVPSVPCFELWLLLHYADIQAFHHRATSLGGDERSPPHPTAIFSKSRKRFDLDSIGPSATT
jgi:hypothetical protein